MALSECSSVCWNSNHNPAIYWVSLLLKWNITYCEIDTMCTLHFVCNAYEYWVFCCFIHMFSSCSPYTCTKCTVYHTNNQRHKWNKCTETNFLGHFPVHGTCQCRTIKYLCLDGFVLFYSPLQTFDIVSCYIYFIMHSPTMVWFYEWSTVDIYIYICVISHWRDTVEKVISHQRDALWEMISHSPWGHDHW